MGKIKIYYENKEFEIDKGTPINKIVPLYKGKYPIVGAIINNKIKDLNYKLKKDCNLKFLDMSCSLGIKIYERSLVFLLVKAIKDIIPNEQLSVEHSVGGGLYCEIKNGRILQKDEFNKIQKRIKELIKKDIPFNKNIVSKEEADKILKKYDEQKSKLFKYIDDDKVKIYELDGYYNYFYGQMLPSTGYFNKFKLRYYYPGLILLIPHISNPFKVREFVEQKKLFYVFSDYEKWGNYLNIYDVPSLNEKIESGQIHDYIKVAEANHGKLISRIADEIYKYKDKTRVVLIAGPSSAGKTTTSKRLRTHLMVNGLRPITIELDNYFVDRDKTPLDENGNYDFENIDAIDIKLFNQHLLQLMEGKEVEIPKFNFLSGKREKNGRKVRLQAENPIIIEGIHGLNEKLTRDIPRENKYKIYINALTQLNIDSHNRIPTTNTRLIRRIVRDYMYRGHNAETTLKMWSSVRRGEEKYIFPYQEEADYIFNSALFYELAVLKKYAEPLLHEICEDSEYFPHAERLLNFLDFFLPIEDESTILTNSVLREFIGGSIYR